MLFVKILCIVHVPQLYNSIIFHIDYVMDIYLQVNKIQCLLSKVTHLLKPGGLKTTDLVNMQLYSEMLQVISSYRLVYMP